jgi:hypothetical protein
MFRRTPENHHFWAIFSLCATFEHVTVMQQSIEHRAHGGDIAE